MLSIPWLVGTSIQAYGCLLSLCVFTASSCAHDRFCVQISLLIRTQSHWIRVHPNDLILTWLSLKTLFPNKVTFWGSGVRTAISLLGGKWFGLDHGEQFNMSYSIHFPRSGQHQIQDLWFMTFLVTCQLLHWMGVVTRGASSSGFRLYHRSCWDHLREESLPSENLACEKKTDFCSETWTGPGVSSCGTSGTTAFPTSEKSRRLLHMLVQKVLL